MEILKHVKTGKMNKRFYSSIYFVEEGFMLKLLAWMRVEK